MKKKEMKLKAKDMNYGFCENHENYEQYSIVYSKTMKRLVDRENGASTDDSESNDNDRLGTIDRYIKISYKGKSVFRKCIAKAGTNSDEIGIAYRTQKELGLSALDGGEYFVDVQAADFLSYYLHNSDRHIKAATWIGFIGFLLTVISSIISILSLFIDYPLFLR